MRRALPSAIWSWWKKSANRRIARSFVLQFLQTMVSFPQKTMRPGMFSLFREAL